MSVSSFGDTAKIWVHVVVVTGTGGIHHTIRRPDGSFEPFKDLKLLAGDPGTVNTVGTYVIPNRLG